MTINDAAPAPSAPQQARVLYLRRPGWAGRRMVVMLTTAAMAGAGALALSAPASADTTVTPVTVWTDLQPAFTAGGTVTLGGDITAPDGGSLVVAAGTPVTLDLHGYTLTITGPGVHEAAVAVSTGADFTVEDTGTGNGTLTATGGSGGAGVGGALGGGAAGGSVTVNGGTVTATGINYAAGVGGGDGGSGGSLVVNGGTLDATGYSDAAGVGGGLDGSGGSVTVNGGTLTATGGDGYGGAGVGGGDTAAGGSVTVNGGTLTATGGGDAAGVGGGYDGSGGPVTVTGGTLTAVGHYFGAGVGGGEYASGGSATVTGGTVTATGGGYGGAGVGGGYDGSVGPVTVKGGTVTATGGEDAAGVGGGDMGAGGSVTVSGGTLAAAGSDGGAGVGGGYGGTGGAMSIGVGGSVTATSGAGSAVGAGESGVGFGSLSNAGTLTVPAGSVLTVPADATVDDSGTLDLAGTLTGDGTVVNTGVISGSGSVAGQGQGPVGSSLLVTVNNYALAFDTGGSADAAPAEMPVFADTVADGGQSLPAGPTPPTSLAVGSTFAGWFTAASGGTEVTNGTDLDSVLDGPGPITATLYAHYLRPQAPTVTGVSASSGPAVGGSTVTVKGTGLSGASEVDFGATPGTAVTVNGSTSLTVTDPAHNAGTVDVTVTTAGGTSATSAADQFTYLAPQTISFPAISDHVYGDADFDPGASASSGLPVSYASSTPAVCSIVSNDVHILGVGKCTVTASQAGEADYLPATPVSQSVTIDKAPIVTAVTARRTLFTSTFTVEVTSAVTGAGVSGEPVTISAVTQLLGSKLSCQATTGASGSASCSVTSLLPLQPDYTVTVGATADYLASTKTQ